MELVSGSEIDVILSKPKSQIIKDNRGVYMFNVAEITLEVIGILSAILTIALFISPNLRVWVVRILSSITGVKYIMPWGLGKIREEIAEAKSDVAILQTWLPTLNRDLGSWESLDRNLRFRILLLDFKLVRHRASCRNCQPITSANLSAIERFNSQSEVQIGVKLYKTLPFGPIYIIDENIYWGIYLSNIDSMVGPQFCSRRDSPLGRLIESSFEAIWESVDLYEEAETSSERPHRYCQACGAWLSYRDQGPRGALLVEGYCANEECELFSVTIATPHVS